MLWVTASKSPCCWLQHAKRRLQAKLLFQVQFQATSVPGKTSPWWYQKQLPKAWTGAKSVDQWADNPAKTKRRGIRQYLPKKIHKWGFKNFVRASELGIMYDFFIYSGANTRGGAQWSCEDIVLSLIEYLPTHQNFCLFLDNWFSTISLIQKEQGRPPSNSNISIE